jgi:hypothetical protein
MLAASIGGRHGVPAESKAQGPEESKAKGGGKIGERGTSLGERKF